MEYRKPYDRHRDNESASIPSQKDINVLYGISQLAAIFNFTLNAMSKAQSGHTTKSGKHENQIVDTQIMNMFLFC